MVLFWLQIVDVNGKVVTLPDAGGKLERDLIAACTNAIVSKGVGVFKTEAQVRKAIEDGITETFTDLKLKTEQVVSACR